MIFSWDDLSIKQSIPSLKTMIIVFLIIEIIFTVNQILAAINLQRLK